MGPKYQVQLSDTARADFEQLQGDAESQPDALTKLMEVRAMLDQIAEVGSAASDRVLPASSPDLELRYRCEGGVYLYFRRFESLKTVVVAFFCEMQVESAAQFNSLATTQPPRLLDLQVRDIPHGMEAESAVEFTGEDGSRRRSRTFVRKVEWGDSYTVLNHFAMDDQPARTMITSGQRGEVEGDWRRDVLEVVEMFPDGSIRRFPPQTVPVWTHNPFYEGASIEDMLARMQKDTLWQSRLNRIRSLMSRRPEPT